MRLNPFQKMSITAFQFVYLFLSMVGSANYFIWSMLLFAGVNSKHGSIRHLLNDFRNCANGRLLRCVCPSR